MTGGLEGLPNWAGQGVGLVSRMLPAADILKEITDDAVRLLENARTLIYEQLVIRVASRLPGGMPFPPGIPLSPWVTVTRWRWPFSIQTK